DVLRRQRVLHRAMPSGKSAPAISTRFPNLAGGMTGNSRRIPMLKHTLVTLAALAIRTSAALAHVSLQLKEAPVGSTYRAILQVPHGCEGKSTNVLRVQIPEGVIAVKPQPKA